MNEKTNKTVRLSVGAAVGVMSVILGALLIWQVLDIYVAGVNAGLKEYIFTQPALFSRFVKISPAFFIWVALVIASFAVSEVFPLSRKRAAYNDARYSLYRLKKRMPYVFPQECAEDLRVIRRERNIFGILWLAVAALGVALSIYAVVYLATPSNFPFAGATVAEKNAVMGIMTLHLLPCVAAVLAAACAVAVYEGISAKKQLPYAKRLAAVKKTAENSVKPVPENGAAAVLYKVNSKFGKIVKSKYFLLGLRIAVGCAAVAFIIAGIFNGNAGAVLRKAINICMECIGIG